MSTHAIDLAAPRIIVIEDRGKPYSLTVGRITKAQWLKYFAGVTNTSELIDGKEVQSYDTSAARLDLVESSLIGAEGYPLTDGRSVTSFDGWQKLLPISHRHAVGLALVNAAPAPPEDAAFSLGFESVCIDAMWGAAENRSMQMFHGLLHVFKTPSVEHQRRFAREASRSTIVGGHRRGKTVYHGAQAVLVDLYDELIVRVEGYQVNGTPLSEAESIAREMDAFHKFVAANALFAPAMPKMGEED